MEAAFAPGQGWSIVRLSADGDTPAVLVRHALFGTPEARDAARIQYQTSLRAAVDRLAQAAAPPPPSPASGAGERLPAARDPKLEAASAPPPAGRAQPVRVTNPAYARRPTNDELAGLYPERALAGNVSGQSTMTCTVGVNGQLSACVSASETPRGYRFGQAGVEAARYFRMTPRTEDGRAVESRVNISINWTL
ncbi:MAG: hypothetical protein EON94_10840 [Caulobacteraceae bacterium]|nr:MAG: hypothetical protein EON94_10840 [Caulobacteraceae bacterium]